MITHRFSISRDFQMLTSSKNPKPVLESYGENVFYNVIQKISQVESSQS